MTDDELSNALVALYMNDHRGVVGSSDYHLQPEYVPQERRDELRRQFAAKGWSRKERRVFLLRLLRDRVLTDEALDAGLDETDIRMYFSYVEALRYPENFE